MAVKIWTTDIKNCYVWSTAVKWIYCWTTKVRPTGWTPWANTIAYYPLNSETTVNDKSGNGYNLTNSSVSFWLQSGIDCAYTTNWVLSATISTLPLSSSARTISTWCLVTSSTWAIWSYWNQSSKQQCTMYKFVNNIYMSWYGDDINTWTSFPSWWCNIVYTYNGTTWRIYLWWTLIKEQAQSLNTNWTTFRIFRASNNGDQMQWRVWETIIENKVRTATEISKYYNDTKADYWL